MQGSAPTRPADTSRGLDGCPRVIGRGAIRPKLARHATDIGEEVADLSDGANIREIPMAWHDDCRLETREFVQNVDPVVGVDVRLERREVRHDRKLTNQDEVAREQHAVINEHHLVVGSMGRPIAAQHRSVTAEVELQVTIKKHDVRFDELDA